MILWKWWNIRCVYERMWHHDYSTVISIVTSLLLMHYLQFVDTDTLMIICSAFEWSPAAAGRRVSSVQLSVDEQLTHERTTAHLYNTIMGYISCKFVTSIPYVRSQTVVDCRKYICGNNTQKSIAFSEMGVAVLGIPRHYSDVILIPGWN